MIERTRTGHRGRTRVPGSGGFTLIELLLVMALSLFVLMAATQVLISMTTQFKQQTRIAQKSIETGFGLDMLKKDISLAGYALPTGTRNNAASAKIAYDVTDWGNIFTNAASYREVQDPEITGASAFNFVYNAPLMMEAGPSLSSVNNSSYFVIRSAAVGNDPGAGKFVLFVEGTPEDGSNLTGVKLPPEDASTKDRWSLGYKAPEGDLRREPDIGAKDLVIVINTRDEDNLGLVYESVSDPSKPNYFTTFDATNNFRSEDKSSIHIIYSISSESSGLCAPFNRVDYYVSDEDVPSKCAPGTGVLYRSHMIHRGPGQPCTLSDGVKVMECVATMRVFFELDTNGDDYVDSIPDPDTGLTHSQGFRAADFGDPMKEVDVFILTHDGTLDPNYTYTGAGATDGKIPIVDTVGSFSFNKKFDVKTMIDLAAADTPLGVARTIQGEHEWKRYRWRVLKLTAQPNAKGTKK